MLMIQNALDDCKRDKYSVCLNVEKTYNPSTDSKTLRHKLRLVMNDQPQRLNISRGFDRVTSETYMDDYNFPRVTYQRSFHKLSAGCHITRERIRCWWPRDHSCQSGQ